MGRGKRWFGAVVVAGLIGTAATAWAEGFSWAGVAEAAAVPLEQARDAYRAGDADGSRQALLTAYFGVFEDRKMEAALRKELGQQHTVAVESRFNQLRKGVAAGVAAEAFAGQVSELVGLLREDARILDARGVPEQVYVGR